MDGLYKDKKDQLYVVIHLEDGELLEWGEDLSKDFNLPQYTVISSGESDFLRIEHSKDLKKINNVKYKCIRFYYQSHGYIYVDVDKFRNFIKDKFEKINGDYTRLIEFIRKYSDLICAIGDKDN